MSDAVSLATVTVADFAPHVATVFTLILPGGDELPLTLLSATPLGRDTEAYPQRRPFSLVFAGPPAIKLPQQIYPLRHGALGPLDIFLVPIRETADERHYEAVFT